MRKNITIHDVVEFGDMKMVRSLLDQGADVNARNRWNATPLHIAAEYERPEVVRLLLDAGADIHARDDHDMTPLDVAAWSGRKEVTRLLLENGAADDKTDLQRAVRAATMDNGYEVIPILQEFGAQIGLVESMYLEDAEAVYRFLDDGADLEQPYDGDTLLIHAVAAALDHICANFVPLLLERGADVNAPSSDGMTPLMVAAKWGKTELVRLLLQHGADPNVRAHHGQTALSLTKAYDREVSDLLKQAGAI